MIILQDALIGFSAVAAFGAGVLTARFTAAMGAVDDALRGETADTSRGDILGPAFLAPRPNPVKMDIVGLRVRQTQLAYSLRKAVKNKAKRSHIIAELQRVTNEILALESSALKGEVAQ